MARNKKTLNQEYLDAMAEEESLYSYDDWDEDPEEYDIPDIPELDNIASVPEYGNLREQATEIQPDPVLEQEEDDTGTSDEEVIEPRTDEVMTPDPIQGEEVDLSDIIDGFIDDAAREDTQARIRNLPNDERTASADTISSWLIDMTRNIPKTIEKIRGHEVEIAGRAQDTIARRMNEADKFPDLMKDVNVYVDGKQVTRSEFIALIEQNKPEFIAMGSRLYPELTRELKERIDRIWNTGSFPSQHSDINQRITQMALRKEMDVSEEQKSIIRKWDLDRKLETPSQNKTTFERVLHGAVRNRGDMFNPPTEELTPIDREKMNRAKEAAIKAEQIQPKAQDTKDTRPSYSEKFKEALNRIGSANERYDTNNAMRQADAAAKQEEFDKLYNSFLGPEVSKRSANFYLFDKDGNIGDIVELIKNDNYMAVKINGRNKDSSYLKPLIDKYPGQMLKQLEALDRITQNRNKNHNYNKGYKKRNNPDKDHSAR